MSYQYNANCYSDQLSAARAIASDNVGRVVVIGTASYSIDIDSVASNSINYKLQDLNSTAFIIKTVSVNPPDCQLFDTADGLMIGWGIAAAWLATAAVLFLRKGLHE